MVLKYIEEIVAERTDKEDTEKGDDEKLENRCGVLFPVHDLIDPIVDVVHVHVQDVTQGNLVPSISDCHDTPPSVILACPQAMHSLGVCVAFDLVPRVGNVHDTGGEEKHITFSWFT